MRPTKRRPVSKGKSVRQFRKASARTQKRNMTGPMRGGLRI